MISTLQSFTPPPLNASSSSSSSSKRPLPPPLGNSHLFFHPSSLLLELCSNSKELNQFLPLIVKQGLFTEHIIQTKLVALFSRFGSLKQASLVFSSIPDKTHELYHSVLKGHCHHSSLSEAIRFFCLMKQDQIRHSVYNFTYLLKACGDIAELRVGREVHAQLVANGFGSNVYAMTAVVNMYAKCRKIDDARKMFDRIPERDLVAWNAAASGFAQNGLAVEALEMVSRMQEEGVRPDSITLVSALPACADTRCLKIGKSIHAFAIRAGFEHLVNVSTALLDMYAKCGAVVLARLVFDRLRAKNVISWNSMIDGYAQNGDAEEAMRLYKRMLVMGIKATEVTVLAALNACSELGDLEEGKRIHELALSIGLGSNVSVMNSLITMYSKCKRTEIAAKVFEDTKVKTLVSWNAMILGYAQNECTDEALRLFCQMQLESNIKPDSFTLVSVIPAVADVSVMRGAKWVHGYAIRMCLDQNVFVATALVDMYAKCGGVALARKVFDSMVERHVTTWNAMIDGYGTHGFGNEAINLFEEMKNGPIEPNDVTFLCVLSACSHAGLVDEGKRLFESMKDYGLKPIMDHYGTMVDLLGRAGKLDEAWNFIENLPIEPGISVYGAMLGACKIHKNVKLGELAAKRLFELEPEGGGYHVLLANIYATSSMWNDVARIRKQMEKKGLQKTPGCTFIELRNKLHTFYSGSTNHPQSKKIYAKLQKLMDEIREIGYVPDTEDIHDVEDDVQVQLLVSHSEKLAIAFGLLNTKAGETIQIKKNLRVCRDCHTATKFISQVTGREIIVRDMQRFHHFKGGHCSCGDY